MCLSAARAPELAEELFRGLEIRRSVKSGEQTVLVSLVNTGWFHSACISVVTESDEPSARPLAHAAFVPNGPGVKRRYLHLRLDDVGKIINGLNAVLEEAESRHVDEIAATRSRSYSPTTRAAASPAS